MIPVAALASCGSNNDDHATSISEPAPSPLGRAPENPRALLSDGLADKGFSLTPVLLPNRVELHVYNLHSGAQTRRTAINMPAMEALAEYINEHSKDKALLVGGDFNIRTPPGEEPHYWLDFIVATKLADICDSVPDCANRGDVGTFIITNESP